MVIGTEVLYTLEYWPPELMLIVTEVDHWQY